LQVGGHLRISAIVIGRFLMIVSKANHSIIESYAIQASS
jgi:hypothetical protein